MRTLIAMMLLTASLLMTAPTASACSVFEDPTGVTPTCVDVHEDGHGDETCGSSGAHTAGATATTSVPDVASLHAEHSAFCSNDGVDDASRGFSNTVVVTVDGLHSLTISQSTS